MDQSTGGTGSSANLGRRIVVILCALVLTLLIVRNMLVLVALDSHRAFGLSELIWPGDAGLTLLDEDVVEVEVDWTKHDPESVFAIASETHRLDPLDNWPFMLAGSLFERIGETDKAITLFEYSVRLDPRSPAPRLHLIENLINAQRADEALTQIVRLARLNPDRELMKALVTLMVRAPQYDLIPRLNAYPDVRDRFLAEASQSSEAEPYLAKLLSQPGIDRQLRWDQINQLAKRGSVRTAYAIWQRFDDASDGSVFDPEFQGRNGPAAFRWQMNNDSDIVTGIVPEKAGGSLALDVELFGDTITQATRQTVHIAPGPHTLKIVGKAIDPPEIGGTMRWDVTCEKSDKPLVRIVFALSAKPVTRSAAFTIPSSGCDFQTLALSAVPDAGSQPFRMRFSRITID